MPSYYKHLAFSFGSPSGSGQIAKETSGNHLMQKPNWKTLLLVGGVGAIGAAILLLGIASTVRLPIFGWHGLGSFVILLVLTLLSSRFTVPVTNVDGTSPTHQSLSASFI